MALSQEEVLAHSKAFESLLMLIPARYLAPPDREAMELKYMKKNERTAAKMRRKNEYKEKKRRRLNPEHADSGKAGEGGQAEEVASFRKSLGMGIGKEAVGREELQARLRAKIQEKRTARHAGEEHMGKAGKHRCARDVKRKTRKGEKKSKKRLLKENAPLDGGAGSLGAANTEAVASKKKRRCNENTPVEGKRNSDIVPLELGRIELGDEGRKTDLWKGKSKTGGKRRSKEEMLEIAESIEQKRKVFQETGQGGQEVMKTAWSAALTRAGGQKVLDNPKLLKKSIRREQHDKLKRKKKWDERKAKVEEDMGKRQEKRKANLQARADARKQKLIAKRARRK